ncbi:MAG: hypothetical protein A2624_06790 [Gammaproteobacteria bacterium RIFCSPHIGHO2_01_FULL_42_8]|nr:MAG: hypothetical protein A3B71_08045 [Gammaproteobacteria bacterium RIFCSPHIGHO2_02_FULL_42_43]OGT27424.1 MAG: hypothetical protein A2624_06790 [Gammaproteobacteria bacterium RIFCSPHIGHO2_01_FULL_42_8]
MIFDMSRSEPITIHTGVVAQSNASHTLVLDVWSHIISFLEICSQRELRLVNQLTKFCVDNTSDIPNICKFEKQWDFFLMLHERWHIVGDSSPYPKALFHPCKGSYNTSHNLSHEFMQINPTQDLLKLNLERLTETIEAYKKNNAWKFRLGRCYFYFIHILAWLLIALTLPCCIVSFMITMKIIPTRSPLAIGLPLFSVAAIALLPSLCALLDLYDNGEKSWLRRSYQDYLSQTDAMRKLTGAPYHALEDKRHWIPIQRIQELRNAIFWKLSSKAPTRSDHYPTTQIQLPCYNPRSGCGRR